MLTNILLLLILLNCTVGLETIFLNGKTGVNITATYGTKNVASSTNHPGSRSNGACWTKGDEFWLFGGEIVEGSLNDLWKWDGVYWTWVNGRDRPNYPGNYGKQSSPDLADYPGSRSSMVYWKDSAGFFYIWGGYGAVTGPNGATFGVFNDMWRWDGTYWIWITGSSTANEADDYPATQGTSSVKGIGARYDAVYLGTVDDRVIIYGGGLLNKAVKEDVWQYSFGTWVWSSGSKSSYTPPNYVTNNPGARTAAASWRVGTDIYVFGGEGQVSGGLNYGTKYDTWKYDTIGQQWTLLDGSDNLGYTGEYNGIGNAGSPTARDCRTYNLIDSNGDIYLFGGKYSISSSYLNDLWLFNKTSYQWILVNGNNTFNLKSVFSPIGQRSETGYPGGRYASFAAVNDYDQIIIYGGIGQGPQASGYLADLWAINLAPEKVPNITLTTGQVSTTASETTTGSVTTGSNNNTTASVTTIDSSTESGNIISDDSSEAAKSNVGYIILGVLFGVLFVVVAIILFMVIRIKRRGGSSYDGVNSSSSSVPPASLFTENQKDTLELKTISVTKIVPFIDNVQLREKLFHGRYGEVFLGSWNGTKVTMTKFSRTFTEENSESLGLLCSLRHPNVVQTLGVYKFNIDAYVVQEYVDLGILHDYLEKKNSIATYDLIQCVHSISKGMVYLSEQGILHGCLSTNSVLLTNEDGNYVCKITNFGLANADVSIEKYDTRVRWTSPEMISKIKGTTASDVYSFGTLMWECFSQGKKAYDELPPEEISKKILDGAVLEKPPACPDSIYTMIVNCWKLNPEVRPTFNVLVHQLKEIKKKFKATPEAPVKIKRNTSSNEQSAAHYGEMDSSSSESETTEDRTRTNYDFVGNQNENIYDFN